MFKALQLIRKMSSTATTPLLLELVSETVSAVNIAGGIVRKVLHSGNLDIVDKGINDLQTKADRAAQQYLVNRLRSCFPKISIIGEEGEGENESIEDILNNLNSDTMPCNPKPLDLINERKIPTLLQNISQEDIVVWIDPLDGTAEFTQGLLSHVTVLVGIAVNGTSIAGVIHQPFYEVNKGRTIWGIPEYGFGGCESKRPPEGTRIVTTTRSHSSAKVEEAIKKLSPDQVIRVGGAGHKAIMLIEGKAHGYVFASAGCKKWDTCAPESVLKSVGGVFTDLDGKVYQYHKTVQHVNDGGILATAPGEDHSWYLSKVKSN